MATHRRRVPDTGDDVIYNTYCDTQQEADDLAALLILSGVPGVEVPPKDQALHTRKYRHAYRYDASMYYWGFIYVREESDMK